MLFVLCSLPGFSQNFPVQVIPQTIPPAPIYVSSYADANTLTGPLRVQIILNDFEIANREIRLKTYFTGSGLNFQSNDIVVGASPLFLEGGVPLVLTHVELAPYFEFNNISGISPNRYGNAIPEGAYQFCVEVYDALTGSRISQRSCAVSVVFQNEPPFLVLPRNKINVDETNPQYIVFQWTPRSINVSNVAYELSLVEIWDNQVDPQQAFLSSPPVFQTTTSATTYVYGPADPLLLSGKNYAWRVQAKAKQGLEEIGLFKNQGYSEIFSFSYAGACDLPIGINHEVKGSTNANIFWDDFSTEIPEYTVRYRKKGNDNEWFESKTAGNFLTLWNLSPGTIYEYQLRKKCSVTESDWSFEKQFTTFLADDEDSIYECGIPPNFDISNKEPLQNLGVNEEFTAGDFPIKVLGASGSNGRFTGKGYVTIPYLRNIRVGVEFTNVLINSDRKLLEGSVITMYDPSLGNILDIDDAIDTVNDVTDSVGELFEGDNDLDEIQVDWTIGSKDEITIEDGMVVITNPNNGVTKKEPLGDDMIITDQEGNTYYVSPEGEITEGGQITPGEEVNPGNVSGVSNNGDLEGLTAENIKVTFNSKGTYGFDKMPSAANTNEKLKKEYTIIKDATGGDYVLPHHAVKKGGTTQIQATIEIENNAYTPDQVVFKNKQGKIFTPTSINGNTATISLDGVYSFENETIYAVVPSKEDTSKQLTAGAFTLWHLTEKTIDVAIVSVGASFGDVATAVNGIFGNGLAKINFKNSISVDVNAARTVLGSNGMDVGESPLTAAYNDEQKALRALSKSAGANDSDTYYVIVLGSDFSNTKGIAGFMPLQRQFGFVFEQYASNGDEGKGSVANTVAHEIGHGVFALQHPFTQYGSARESTDWLMDYSNGTNLPHTHWSQMHDPALKFYLFQDEEEGESVSSSAENEYLKEVVTQLISNIKSSYKNNENGELEWKKLMHNRCVTQIGIATDCSLISYSNFELALEGYNLNFRVKSQPSTSLEKFTTSKEAEDFEIVKRRILFLGSVYDLVYQLTINDALGNSFILEFDHHDDIEQFCKYAGINGKLNQELTIRLEVIANEQQGSAAYNLGDNQNVQTFLENQEQDLAQIDLDEVVVTAGHTNISKNIVYTLNKDYLVNLTSVPNCNEIDLYFAEIPVYALYALAQNELWNALKGILNCKVDERYTNEERAIITLIKGLGNQNADNLLSGLLTQKIDNQSLLSLLFEKIDDWGGADNFTETILTLFDYWKVSQYAKLSYEPIAYESSKSLMFYSANYNLDFSEDCSQVVVSYDQIVRGEITNSLLGPTANYSSENVFVDQFNSYQPMLMLNSLSMETAFEIGTLNNVPIVPMFLLKAIDVKNFTNNVEQGTYMAVDIAATFSGVGNLAKLRHLNSLRHIRDLKIIVGAVEFTSGTAGLALEFSDCQTDVCKKMRTYLLIVEIASLGSDAYLSKASKALKKSADDALEAIDKANYNASEELLDELRTVSRANVKSIDELLLLVEDEYRATLRLDLDASDDLVAALTDNPNLIDSWKVMENHPILRKNVEQVLNPISKWISNGSSADQIALTLSKSNSKKKLIQEIQKAGGYKAWKSALANTTGGIFKIGDNILDFTVKQVKKGTNDKIAIIGRSMGSSKIKGVKDIHKELIKKGNKAEIFDASSLKGKWLERFEDAMEQFKDKTNNWTKRLSNQELLQLDMYKLNKEWVGMLKKDGYTILDMGDFNNQGFSAFYAMEKNIIFN